MNQINSEPNQNLINFIEMAKSRLNIGVSKLDAARYIFPQIDHLSAKQMVEVFMKGFDLRMHTAKSYRFIIKRDDRLAKEKLVETNNKSTVL
jgi:hypothetical protein